LEKALPHTAFKKSLLCAITLCFWFAQYVYIPFFTPYLLSLGFTATVAGVIVGAYGVMQMLLRVPLGLALDIRNRHRLVISLGALLAGSSSLLMLLFPSPWMLFLANTLSGAASAAWISYTILFASYYDSSRSARAFGVINIFSQAGLLLAFLAGGLLVGRFGVQALFKLSFAVGLAGALLAWLLPCEVQAQRGKAHVAELLQVFQDRRVITISLLCSVAWLTLFATVFSFTSSTAKALGASGVQLGVLSILYSSGAIAGAYAAASRLGHHWKEENSLLLGFAILAIYAGALAFAPALWLFFPLQFLCGLGAGLLMAVLMTFAVKQVAPEKKSAAMGCYQSIYCLGIIGGPIVMGVLIDRGGRAFAFCAIGLAALFCALLAPLLYRVGFLKQS
jgi:predicted MFS family arabinose efflux permease